MRVVSAVAFKPEPQPVGAIRAVEPLNDYWFLLSAGSRDLIPFKGIAAEQTAAFEPPANAETSMAGPISEIGQLAVDATLRLKQQTPAEMLRKVDVVIVCTSGIDSQFGVSLAGKVQHALNATNAFPFTIGQVDGCSAFAALRMARAFMYGPERARVVAIVATECWSYPYVRSYGDYAQYGDGAAAVLLCADHVDDTGAGILPGGPAPGPEIEIGDVALGRYQAQEGPFDLRDTQWFRTDDWPQAVGNFLADFLRKRGLSAPDLAAIRSPSLSSNFIRAVAQTSGLPLVAGRGGFVSAVDPLLAFQVSDGDQPETDAHTLCWSVGLNGEMGAYLYRRSANSRGSSNHARHFQMDSRP
jgi:3-oxoacyl-[acyl-carrier-protein] synthase III